MKAIYLLFLSLCLSLFSCGQASESGPVGDLVSEDYATDESGKQVSDNQEKKGKVLVMTAMHNPKTGELIGHIPIPKDWKIEGGSFVGPNGIKTSDYPNRFFTFEQRWPMDLEEVVRQDIAPEFYQNGGKILGTFVIPELENYDRAYYKLLWTFGEPNTSFHVLGVDCETPDGQRALLILRQMISESPYGSSWGYYINILDANKDAYEEAKSDFIFALSHVQPDMEQIQRYNQREIAKSNASWAAHSQRMAANQAAFNARNQAWMDASNGISDMSMKGWRARNEMTDAGHANTINSIHEEQTITDPSTGQSMQVEAGSNRYFTNSNNEYIRTDSYFYDPNADHSVNHYEWKEWKGN